MKVYWGFVSQYKARADHALLHDPANIKKWQEAVYSVHKHVASLAGVSVDGATATKLQVLEAAIQAALKSVLLVTAGGVRVGFWRQNACLSRLLRTATG